MWIEIDGVNRNYKSINFTLLRDELIDGTKSQTARTNFIPYFKQEKEKYEIVVIKFKGSPLFLVPIENYYPTWIKDLTEEEAKRDGFDDLEDFKRGLMELNKIEDSRHICIIIQWNPEERVMLEVIAKKKKKFICKTKGAEDIMAFA